MFLDRWEEEKNYVQMLTQYNQLRRGNEESVKSFSSRFNMIYNSLPIQCKPQEEWQSYIMHNPLMMNLHYSLGKEDLLH